MWGMGKAGRALKQILEAYSIPQNRLAVAMGIDRSNISRWVSEERDPTGDAISDIKDALEQLSPPAAEEFVKLYLYGSGRDESTWDKILGTWPQKMKYGSVGYSISARNFPEALAILFATGYESWGMMKMCEIGW